MVESGNIYSQEKYDATLGLPEELRGQLSLQAQVARHKGLIEQGVPDDMARTQLGLTDREFEIAALEITQKGE